MKKYLLAIFTLLVVCNLTTASNWDLLKPGKRWNVVLTGLSPDGEKINENTPIKIYFAEKAGLIKFVPIEGIEVERIK